MNMTNVKRQIKDLGKSWLLHRYYPALYRRAALARVRPRKVVFLEVRQEQLSDSFTLLWEAMKQQGGYEMHAVCLREGMVSHRQAAGYASRAIRVMADAAWIFVNDSSYVLSALPLRPETRVVQLWHACGAFKKFGYSSAGKQFGSGEKELERFPLHKNMSYVTVSSPEVSWAYAEAFNMSRENILPIGVSRTDVFYDEQRLAAARKKALQYLPRGRKILLYAPTFRGRVAHAVSPAMPDFSRMHEVMGDEWIFVCNHHPFVRQRPEIEASQRAYTFDLTGKLSIEQLLMISDICISDYSSLVFEYSLLQRPMIFYAPDLKDYQDWRGFYYPYEEMTPGPVVEHMEELLEYLANVETWFDPQEMKRFRDRFMGSCDGHATQRILELIHSA